MPPEPRKSFLVRLDPGLHAALERMAAADVRSLNAEIEVLLRQALRARGVRLDAGSPPRRGRPPREDGRE